MIEKTEQEFYNIGALAKLAGISVRTLHYYDQTGLLNPSFRDENDYRLYDFNDLLRLQQILFFRELEVPLKKIKEILDDSREDWIEMLERHYHHLDKQINRLQKLQGTIKKTIHNLEEKAKMPLTDAELYEGFSKEKFKRYQREARNAYGHEKVEATNNRLRSMSKAEWNAVKEEGANIAVELGALINRDPADPDVQALIARQHTWIENFYPAPAEVFRSLGDLYANHPEFRANYEQYAPGLADFLQEAMKIYADRILSNNP